MRRTASKGTQISKRTYIKTAAMICLSFVLCNNVLAFNNSPSTINKSMASASTSVLPQVSNNTTSYTHLRPFTAKFVAYRSGNDVGNAIIELKTLTSSQFELHYESDVSRFFLSDKRFEKTIFSNTDGNLIPHNYRYKRTGTGANKALSLVFDQKQKKIQMDDGSELEWQGELDNQLFRIDFAHQLANGHTSTHYDFINYRGQKKDYTLEVISTDNLVLPYGNITAIKVLVGRDSSTRVTYAWFAPSLNYNLVRLQQFKDDHEQADLQLNSFTYL